MKKVAEGSSVDFDKVEFLQMKFLKLFHLDEKSETNELEGQDEQQVHINKTEA